MDGQVEYLKSPGKVVTKVGCLRRWPGGHNVLILVLGVFYCFGRRRNGRGIKNKY